MKNLENTQINHVISLLEKRLQQNESPNTKVVNYLNALDLEKKFKLDSSCPLTTEDYLEEIKKYLEYSVRTNHPLCNNQLFSGVNDEAVIAELISIVTNTTMATFEMSPVATVMEKEIIRKMNETLGISGGDGIMLTGGSNANLMAMHLARHRKNPNIKRTGNTEQYAVFVSDQAHYSHQKAMMLMGLGLDNLINIKSNLKGQMYPLDLEEKIVDAINNEKIPLLVCSTAGTTVMGAFDPIDKVTNICRKYDLWHHVDGAWGGAVMFSSKYKHLLQDMSKVDSFAIDAHKLMGTGLITSFFLTAHDGLLKEANSAGGNSYIFHQSENAAFDIGPKSLQCGRKNDALKMWLTWKSKGDIGLEKVVNSHFENKEYLVDLIEDNPRLKLLFKPEFLNVCYQVLPKDSNVDINRFNFDLRFMLTQSGNVMTNFSSWPDGTTFFRHIIADEKTTKNDLDRYIKTILSFA